MHADYSFMHGCEFHHLYWSESPVLFKYEYLMSYFLFVCVFKYACFSPHAMTELTQLVRGGRNLLVCIHAKSLQSCLTLRCYTLQSARLLCPRDYPGKNTGVGCHTLLQGIFLTQGFSLHLMHCGLILDCWATSEKARVNLLVKQRVGHMWVMGRGSESGHLINLPFLTSPKRGGLSALPTLASYLVNNPVE